MRGITLQRILQSTTPERIQLAAWVVVRNLKFGISRKLQIPKAVAQTYSKDKFKDGRPKLVKYTTMIEFYEENKVKVSCSCEDHIYRWEYALWKKNASYITYSNGEVPVDTNPRLVPGCCKHVVRLFQELNRQKLLPK